MDNLIEEEEKWASDDLEEASKNAEERKKVEEKYKQEENKAEEEKELIRRLKNIKDIKGIMSLQDNAERRVKIVAEELEDTESFVKGIEGFPVDDVEQTRALAQSNTAGRFVHTIFALKENITEA